MAKRQTGKSIRRYAELAGLGLDLASRRGARNSTARASRANDIADRMGRLRGLPQKLGQILSFSELDHEDQRSVRVWIE